MLLPVGRIGAVLGLLGAAQCPFAGNILVP